MHRSYKNYNRKDSRSLSYKTPVKTSDKRKILSYKPAPKEKLKLESKSPKVENRGFDYQYRFDYRVDMPTDYLNFWYASSPVPDIPYPQYKTVSTENFAVKECKYRCSCDLHDVDYKLAARVNVHIICPECGIVLMNYRRKHVIIVIQDVASTPIVR